MSKANQSVDQPRLSAQPTDYAGLPAKLATVESVAGLPPKQFYPTEGRTHCAKLTTVVLIDFFAEWCGPCKMQDPILEELKKKFADKIEFKKVDVDTSNELATKYTIHAVPTLIIEKDGVLFKRYVGVTRANILEADINMALMA